MTQGAFQAKSITETRGMVPHQPMSEGHSHPSRTIVHAKLEMTEPGDHDEQEADVIANTIAAGGKISRKISGGSGSSSITVSNQMESRLNHLQGGGQTMPTGLRNMMESGFGQDFSHVRLHTDSEAASLSSSIHAKAFTHGNDIYFNEGQFSPNTSEGQKLMAHELTHVVQGGGKVARERDINADNFIVDQYFYNSWNWTAFFMFLSNYYPSVVKDMELEMDEDLDWEDFNEEFLKKVVINIIKVEEKKENKRVAGNSAYRNALQSVIIMFSNPPSSQLSKPFMAMAKIAKNYQQNFADNSEYFRKSVTVSLAEARTYHVDGDPLKDVSFDGKIFDNRSNMQKDVYNATRLLNENIANRCFEEESDVPTHGIEFRKQLEKFASEWVDYELDKYLQKNTWAKKNLQSVKDTCVNVKKVMEEKYEKASTQGQKDVIMTIYMLVDNRQKNLYVSHINTSNLVPARVWTNIFMKTMKIELSLFLGSACFANFVKDIVGNAISNEIVQKLAADVITGVIKDSGAFIIDTLNSSPEELKKITVENMLQEFGYIILQNMITSTVDLGLKSLSKPNYIEQERLNELDKSLSQNKKLLDAGDKSKKLQESIETLSKEQAGMLRRINVQAYLSDVHTNVTNAVIGKTFDAIKGKDSSVGLEDYLKLGLPAVISLGDEDAATIVTAFTDNLP